MSEEIFDVVNERDEVVAQCPRSEVHRLGLRHRAVHILVFNGGGEVFLQKRSLSKDTWPGAWDSSASGHLEAGEVYDAAAVRELEEELGLRVASGSAPVRLFKLEACEETGWEFVWVYRLQAEGPVEWNEVEIEEGRWLRPEQVDQWVQDPARHVASAFRLIWTRIGARPGKPPGSRSGTGC